MQNKFEEILKELSEHLNLPLHKNKLNSCPLLIDKKLIIQLELDQSQENLLIGSFVAELPPGKFRENVLLEALKENDTFDKSAVFAYNEKNNSLSLFNYFPLENLDIKKLINHFTKFMQTALDWQDAILSGRSSPNLKESSLDKPFGLK